MCTLPPTPLKELANPACGIRRQDESGLMQNVRVAILALLSIQGCVQFSAVTTRRALIDACHPVLPPSVGFRGPDVRSGKYKVVLVAAAGSAKGQDLVAVSRLG